MLREIIFLASYFSLPMSQVLLEQKYLKNGSLMKTCRESVIQLALVLLC